MANPIILSETNIEEAQSTFNHWLNNEPVTLLIILGKHDVAIQALTKANEMINSGSVYYASVRAVHAPNAECIMPNLKQLKVNPDIKPIDWNNIGQYAILSISNKYNNIGEIISNIDFPIYPGGKINKLVRRAITFDKQL
jgi:hypothetical protein